MPPGSVWYFHSTMTRFATLLLLLQALLISVSVEGFSDWSCAICEAVNCVVFRTTPTKKKSEKGMRKSFGWILGVLASNVALTPGNLLLFRREGVVVKGLAKVMMMIPYGVCRAPTFDLRNGNRDRRRLLDR